MLSISFLQDGQTRIELAKTWPRYRAGFGRESGYCTAIVTLFDENPLLLNTSDTAGPGETAAGTRALTWYKPTRPGVNPENCTGAWIPPSVTVGISIVLDSEAGEAAPVAG